MHRMVARRMPKLVTVPVYARMRGLNRSSVTRMITRRGLPAHRDGPRWLLDPQEADRWIDRNARRAANKIGGSDCNGNAPSGADCTTKTPSAAAHRNGNPGQPGEESGNRSGVQSLLDHLLGTLEVKYDPRAVANVKQMCSELRLLERHRIETGDLEREVRLEYQGYLKSVIKIFADEITGAVPRVAEAVLATLAAAGDSGQDVRLAGVTEAVQQELTNLLSRIADAVEDGDP